MTCLAKTPTDLGLQLLTTTKVTYCCMLISGDMSNRSSLPSRATNIIRTPSTNCCSAERTSHLRDACRGTEGGGCADSFGSGFEICHFESSPLMHHTVQEDQPTRHERGNVCYATAFVSVQLLNSKRLSFLTHFSITKLHWG